MNGIQFYFSAIYEKALNTDYTVIATVQKHMQREIADREIAIETNLSSNTMIDEMKAYDKHPIVRFYNKGLTYDQDKLEQCPQLNVSINTDNQGIFATSLSNEYALIASALDKFRDEEGRSIHRKN